MHNNNLDNLLRGLYERVLFRVQKGEAHQPAQPTAGVFEARLSEFRKRLVELTPRIRRVTRDEFVGSYTGRKRVVYEKAAASLAVRQLTRADAYLSTFVKCEKIDFHAKPDPAPRVIQPRGPRYNVEVGRYLKMHEKKIIDGIAGVFGGRTVMKGLNAEEQAAELRAMWDEFGTPAGIGLDASRFDQHVSKQALQFEHSCYLAMCPMHTRRWLRTLLSWQLVNRGYARAADGVVKYEVEGRRMSGDMNTGLGNCLLMCAMVHAYAKHAGVRVRLANNGDDCMVFMESRHVTKFMAGLDRWFLEMGFRMECEDPVYAFEQVVFCQTQPVYDGVKWVMCRDPRVCLAKDCISVLDLGTACQAWAGAVGECGLALAGGMPVLQAFYHALMRNGKPSGVGKHPWMESGFQMLAKGLHRGAYTVCPEARASFWRAFGMLPDLQEAIEEEMSRWQISPTPARVTNPTLHLVPLTYVQ